MKVLPKNAELLMSWVRAHVEAAEGVCAWAPESITETPPEGRLTGAFFLIWTGKKFRQADLNVKRSRLIFKLVGMWTSDDLDAGVQANEMLDDVLYRMSSGELPNGCKQVYISEDIPISVRGSVTMAEVEITVTLQIEV